MFSVGDYVQPRKGGPKLKVLEVNGDSVVAIQASNEQGEKFTLKAADLVLYTEEGDFGIC
ncbi:hypothetical protein NTH60_000072 [Enterobacter ludwigii]|jgi:uncharacterized protein YodC (DUF2158 family)|uniref:hypothetical protein n=1 Tax=Enterobacter ludwigii TaxID=299767 RepID=UPI00099ACDF1|nr:hypothetical protein [Enterobacter ludwigii]EKS6736148.1 hypothetical protein [Enterobacter ludwigii]OPB26069.1 hypothetical protein BFW94_07115 [Enterobacter ludwigii]